MENFFNNFIEPFATRTQQAAFNAFGPAAAAHAAQPNTAQPPASKNAIAKLPMVKVTADDLLEENNKECLICLEEQVLGAYACKLQCGHLFHRDCVSEWLEKHCTCPVCRFELETDDAMYEQERFVLGHVCTMCVKISILRYYIYYCAYTTVRVLQLNYTAACTPIPHQEKANEKEENEI